MLIALQIRLLGSFFDIIPVTMITSKMFLRAWIIDMHLYDSSGNIGCDFFVCIFYTGNLVAKSCTRWQRIPANAGSNNARLLLDWIFSYFFASRKSSKMSEQTLLHVYDGSGSYTNVQQHTSWILIGFIVQRTLYASGDSLAASIRETVLVPHAMCMIQWSILQFSVYRIKCSVNLSSSLCMLWLITL